MIAANPELRERELTKLAAYAAAVAAALRERGVGELPATLAAEAGMSVLRAALERWANGNDDRSLSVIMKDCMAELRAVTVRQLKPQPLVDPARRSRSKSPGLARKSGALTCSGGSSCWPAR